MRITIAWVLVALAAGAGGCGGATGQINGNATPVTPAGTTTAAQAGKHQKQDPNQSCAAAGIGDPGNKEGTCRGKGVQLVVANGRSRLRLTTLQARIRGIAVYRKLPAEGRRVAHPQGIFVAIKLEVVNHDKVAHRFGESQTMLAMSHEQYEDDGVLERVYPRALANSHRAAIAPGAIGRGEVVFDIPQPDVDSVTGEGRLYVVNFGATLAENIGPTHQVGELRLYV